MADTPNRGYNQPDKGTADWHLPLNQNFGMLDGDVQTAIDHAPLFSTDLSETNRVIVPETGADIQVAIDAFAGAGRDGVVQLLPKSYHPPGPIELKGGVTLRGAGPVNIRGPNAHSWVSAKNVKAGDSLVRWRPNDEPDSASGAQVQQIGFTGERGDGVRAHGLEMPSTVGNPRIINCHVTSFYGSGMLFAGTQSAEVLQSRITRCGRAADDTHGLDVGGAVEAGDFDRATVICAGMFGNGPASDSSPVKLRSGSTLRMKSVGYRSGFRGHGPMDAPIIDIDGGDLEMDNAIVTTNLKGTLAGIRITNGGSAHLHDVVVEKADPNIELIGGNLSLRGCTINQAKTYSHSAAANGLGDGLWVAASGKAEEFTINHTSFFGNQGDGLDLGRPGTGLHVDIDTHANDGWGINTDRLSETFRVIGLDRDPDKPNGAGRISDTTSVAVGSAALE